MKILVVDDSATMRKIIKRTILSIGIYEVLEAEDGLDAVKKLHDDPDVNMILMDINMPKIDGVTALREIKKIEGIKDIPVIMCTSEAEKETVVQCIRLGAADYVVKPFSKEIIQAKIKSVIE